MMTETKIFSPQITKCCSSSWLFTSIFAICVKKLIGVHGSSDGASFSGKVFTVFWGMQCADGIYSTAVHACSLGHILVKKKLKKMHANNCSVEPDCEISINGYMYLSLNV